jgi:hypothetical protein
MGRGDPLSYSHQQVFKGRSFSGLCLFFFCGAEIFFYKDIRGHQAAYVFIKNYVARSAAAFFLTTGLE